MTNLFKYKTNWLYNVLITVCTYLEWNSGAVFRNVKPGCESTTSWTNKMKFSGDNVCFFEFLANMRMNIDGKSWHEDHTLRKKSIYYYYECWIIIMTTMNLLFPIIKEGIYVYGTWQVPATGKEQRLLPIKRTVTQL